jgi:predicted RNA-binding protein YlxR (DUF448 family)
MSRVTPVRTCVGCREHAAKSELIRLVAVADGPSWKVVPDLTGRMPGRGAHLHPTQTCLDHAERRRALPRALRLEGALDISAVQAEIEGRTVSAETDRSTERKRSSGS